MSIYVEINIKKICQTGFRPIERLQHFIKGKKNNHKKRIDKATYFPTKIINKYEL